MVSPTYQLELLHLPPIPNLILFHHLNLHQIHQQPHQHQPLHSLPGHQQRPLHLALLIKQQAWETSLVSSFVWWADLLELAVLVQGCAQLARGGRAAAAYH